VEEQGNPLAGSLTIFRGAAAKLVTAVEVANQFSLTPAGDEFAALAPEEFDEIARFHREWQVAKNE